MPTEEYVRRLEARLAEIDAGLAEAHARLESGDVDDKVAALKDWSHLKTRRADLAERIKAAQAKGAEDWSALHESFREELDALADAVERWLTRET